MTEEQIIRLLKEHEAGATIEELARKHGVAKRSLQRWKSKYGGTEVSEARRLRELEAENAKLKKLLAETLLEKSAVEAALQKNVWSAPRSQPEFTSSARKGLQ